MTDVFKTTTYTVRLNPSEEHNYELVNNLYDVVEYACRSLPQAIETAKMYEAYLSDDQPDQMELYTEYAGVVQ